MDGIIALWKERGMTSHDCVFKLRKILHQKKIGHGGTLDPEVDGVLPICVGKATRVIEFMQDENKIYEGQITLGFSTTTEDAHGEVVELTPIDKEIAIELIDSTMQSFVGDISQIPPMYSAIKHEGKRLYEYAREGITIERQPRYVTVYSFERTCEPELNIQEKTLTWTFKVICSKGTYVRTLAVDVGEKLGFAAHMSKLTRIASCGLEAKDALTLEEIKKQVENGNNSFLFPIEFGVASLQKISCNNELVTKTKFGQLINKSELGKDYKDGTAALLNDGHLCAIVEPHEIEKDFVRPRKVFLPN